MIHGDQRVNGARTPPMAELETKPTDASVNFKRLSDLNSTGDA